MEISSVRDAFESLGPVTESMYPERAKVLEDSCPRSVRSDDFNLMACFGSAGCDPRHESPSRIAREARVVMCEGKNPHADYRITPMVPASFAITATLPEVEKATGRGVPPIRILFWIASVTRSSTTTSPAEGDVIQIWV